MLLLEIRRLRGMVGSTLSQAVTGSQDLAMLELRSFVRSYHAYQTVWDPDVGDVLRLEREPTNSKDRFAIAVMDARSGVWLGTSLLT